MKHPKHFLGGLFMLLNWLFGSQVLTLIETRWMLRLWPWVIAEISVSINLRQTWQLYSCCLSHTSPPFLIGQCVDIFPTEILCAHTPLWLKHKGHSCLSVSLQGYQRIQMLPVCVFVKPWKWLCFICSLTSFRPTEWSLCVPERPNWVDSGVSCLLLTCMTSQFLDRAACLRSPLAVKGSSTWANV